MEQGSIYFNKQMKTKKHKVKKNEPTAIAYDG
jgi:hypothetical protein